MKRKGWIVDVPGNALQMKKQFPIEAKRFLGVLANSKQDDGPIGGSTHWLGSHESFAEENEIVYHIDGVITTHTGEPKGLNNTNHF